MAIERAVAGLAINGVGSRSGGQEVSQKKSSTYDKIKQVLLKLLPFSSKKSTANSVPKPQITVADVNHAARNGNKNLAKELYNQMKQQAVDTNRDTLNALSDQVNYLEKLSDHKPGFDTTLIRAKQAESKLHALLSLRQTKMSPVMTQEGKILTSTLFDVNKAGFNRYETSGSVIKHAEQQLKEFLGDINQERDKYQDRVVNNKKEYSGRLLEPLQTISNYVAEYNDKQGRMSSESVSEFRAARDHLVEMLNAYTALEFSESFSQSLEDCRKVLESLGGEGGAAEALNAAQDDLARLNEVQGKIEQAFEDLGPHVPVKVPRKKDSE